MDINQQGKLVGGLAGLAAGLNPLKSFTFLLALSVTALATWSWFQQPAEPHPPFPLYGTIAASYAGGFLIGRLFRKVVKTAAIVAAIVLGGLALLNRAHMDTTQAREAAQAGSSWVQHQASRAKDYLLHFLPSGGAAGIGVFAGSRRHAGEGGPGRH